MNKKLKLVKTLVFLALSFNINSQTFVSGGIFSNTVWTTANSPYIITNTVVVFPGVNLTIQPGVTVKFNNGTYMEIRQSKLTAIGNSANPITITSSSTTPTAGIWNNIYLNFSTSVKLDYCNLEYATDGLFGYVDTFSVKNSRFSNNIRGIKVGGTVNSPYLIINGSVFRNNTCGIEWLGNSYMQINNSTLSKNQTGFTSQYNTNIINCVVDSNSVVGIIKESGKNDTIRNNLIRYNNEGYVACCGGGGGLTYITKNTITNNAVGFRIYSVVGIQDTVFCNTIANNTLYNLKYELVSNMSFPNNYWGTTNTSIIDALIYDGYDNISYGLANYTPFNSGSCNFITDINSFSKTPDLIRVFPNPVKNILTVTSPETPIQVRIITPSGQELYQNNLIDNDSFIDISNLAVGLYFLEINSVSSKKTEKFIVQK